MKWIVFPINRKGHDWSVRIDNGEGMAFELPCWNYARANALAFHIQSNTQGDVMLGNPVTWQEGKR